MAHSYTEDYHECMTPEYVSPDSTMTLRQGLEEYYRINMNLLSPESLPDDAADMFKRHDAGHVVFGCDTSLRGETLIDTWTVVATTAGVRGYLEYFKFSQVNAIFKEVGFLTITIESIKALPPISRAIYYGLKQQRKWPWKKFESYLDTPLADIRKEFDITVI